MENMVHKDAIRQAETEAAALIRGAMDSQDRREQEAGNKCGVPWEEHGCDWPDAVAEALIASRQAETEAAEKARAEERDKIAIHVHKYNHLLAADIRARGKS